VKGADIPATTIVVQDDADERHMLLRPIERSDLQECIAHLLDVLKNIPVTEELWEINTETKSARMIEDDE
jgi:hypothetical protein